LLFPSHLLAIDEFDDDFDGFLHYRRGSPFEDNVAPSWTDSLAMSIVNVTMAEAALQPSLFQLTIVGIDQ